MRVKRLLFYAIVSLFAIFLLWFVITDGKYMQMCNNKFLTLSLLGTGTSNNNKSLSFDDNSDNSNVVTDSTNEDTSSETASDDTTDLASTDTDLTATNTAGLTTANTAGLTTSNTSYLDIDVYDVNWGDTLSGISRLTGVSVDELAELNHIANPNLIYSGSSIKIRQTP